MSLILKTRTRCRVGRSRFIEKVGSCSASSPIRHVRSSFAGCGGSQAPDEPAEPPTENARPTVFDPLTSTIDRAQGVQQTVDDQAAELRRRVEDDCRQRTVTSPIAE